jgi:hypothetical protein
MKEGQISTMLEKDFNRHLNNSRYWYRFPLSIVLAAVYKWQFKTILA